MTKLHWEEDYNGFLKVANQLIDYCDAMKTMYPNPESIEAVSEGILNLVYIWQKYFVSSGHHSEEGVYELYVDGGGNVFKSGVRGTACIRMYCPISGLRITEKIGDADGNLAELQAILFGIKFLKLKKITRAKIYSDSGFVENINKRLKNKRARVRPKQLREFFDEIIEELKDTDFDLIWVPESEQLAHIK